MSDITARIHAAIQSEAKKIETGKINNTIAVLSDALAEINRLDNIIMIIRNGLDDADRRQDWTW